MTTTTTTTTEPETVDTAGEQADEPVAKPEQPAIVIDLDVPMTVIDAASLALEWMQQHGADRFNIAEATDLRPEILDQLRAFAVPLSYLRYGSRKFVTVSTCRECGVFMLVGSGGTPPTKCVLTRGCTGTMSPKAKKDATAKARFAACLIETAEELESE